MQDYRAEQEALEGRLRAEAKAKSAEARAMKASALLLKAGASAQAHGVVAGDDWERLSAGGRGKDATGTEVLEWVLNNHGRPLDGIDEYGVPSVGAVALLKWARTEDGYKEFMRRCLARVLKVSGGETSFEDDGREFVDLFDRLKGEVARGLTENDEAL